MKSSDGREMLKLLPLALLRLKKWEYEWCAAYFVTICSQSR